MRTDKSRTALVVASLNAANALEATASPEFSHVPMDDKVAWAMAAIIHCDLCRLFIAMEECEKEGIARLLCLGDIASKLYEARNWYNNSGTKTLRAIASRKACVRDTIDARIEGLKQIYQVHRVNKYTDYRNKVGYHYDSDAIAYLHRFGSEDSDEFFSILASYVKFSGAWAQLTKEVVQAS